MTARRQLRSMFLQANRGARLIALSLWWFLVLPLACSGNDSEPQTPPRFRGYALSSRWQEIGRALPCRAIDFAGFPAKQCIASDSLTLIFRRDSLILINARFQALNTGLSVASYWHRNGDQFIREFGTPPDSVSIRVVTQDEIPPGQAIEGPVDRAQLLVADWGASTVRHWAASVILLDVRTSGGPGVMGTVTLVVSCLSGPDCSSSTK